MSKLKTMKKLLLITVASFALFSCRQAASNGEPVEHVSETGSTTSEEASSGGGVKTSPEATSAADGDSTAAQGSVRPGE